MKKNNGRCRQILLKIKKWWKWQCLKPKIRNINEIHGRLTGNGEKVGFFEKRDIKKEFNECRSLYDQYIDYCKKNELSLPDEYDHMIDVINESDEILDPKNAINRELDQAMKNYDEAYILVSQAGENLYASRKQDIEIINKIEELINSIAKHPKEFDDNIAEIKIQKKQFKGTEDFAIKQKKDIIISAGGMAVGATAGAGIASMAPTVAMWVATTFGTASTGTAISALSGAAATNAALAWLGGGTLAAGGGGMIAGQAFLALAGPVGWGIAGTSILASVLFAVFEHKKVLNKKKEEIISLKKCTESLKEVKASITEISIQTETLSDSLRSKLTDCTRLKQSDYTALAKEDKVKLGTLVNNAKSFSVLLNKTIGE